MNYEEFDTTLQSLICKIFPNTKIRKVDKSDLESINGQIYELKEEDKSIIFSPYEIFKASADYKYAIEGFIERWKNILDGKTNRAGDIRIIANCPNCGCDHSDIEYYNCGSIVYLLCPECGYTLKESIDTEMGELFTTWNNKAPVERVSTITEEELQKRQRITKRLENLERIVNPEYVFGDIIEDDSNERENPDLIEAMVLAKQDKDIPEELIQKIKEFK